MDLKDYIRSIKDYPKKGILFRDITTLIKDELAFEETINQIVEKSKKFKVDKIAAIESRGFVFASAVSYILKKPLFGWGAAAFPIIYRLEKGGAWFGHAHNLPLDLAVSYGLFPSLLISPELEFISTL